MNLVDGSLFAVKCIGSIVVDAGLSRHRVESTVAAVVLSIARETRAVRGVAPFGRRATGSTTEGAATAAKKRVTFFI